MTATAAAEVTVTYLSKGYAVTYRDGTIVEHSIPTLRQANARLAFHAERIASIRAWDAARR